jgi:hypothetical protein
VSEFGLLVSYNPLALLRPLDKPLV